MPRIRAENIDAHKELTRSQILETARELFLRDGYAATSPADIAAVIGIGRTTMYEYFRDKEAILVILVEESIPRLVREMIATVPEDLAAGERLGELIVRTLEFVADQRNLGTLIMREAPELSPEAQRRIRAAHQELDLEYHRLCAAGVTSGQFRALDPAWLGRIVAASAMGAARSLLREPDPKQHLHEAADTLIAVLLSGITAPRR